MELIIANSMVYSCTFDMNKIYRSTFDMEMKMISWALFWDLMKIFDFFVLVASRRSSEELIFEGRVTVNGSVCNIPQVSLLGHATGRIFYSC